MSWKPEVYIESEKKWHCNGLVFATKQEAEQNASDLLQRWYVPTNSRAVESNEPVNYSYIDRTLKPVG
jgi:hypothetical protein